MCYINSRFTYLLTYYLNSAISISHGSVADVVGPLRNTIVDFLLRMCQ